jgi:phosphatidylglycerol:prolipoprotein diacylglycerol transferase
MNEYLTKITFPSLNLSLDPSRSFHIGPMEIHWYGLLIAVGLLLAVVYACRRCKTFGLRDSDLIDGVLCIVPFAVICAGAYYCIFQWQAYVDDPISVLYIWQGGLAIYGGVIGAAIGIVVYARIKKDKVKLTAVLDITALGFLIGQSIGRWGNFINREAFGAETTSFLRMGLLNKITGEVKYYHPTFLYESLWNACGFVLLHFLSKKRKYDGQIALGYVAWYGLGRAMIEGLRTDSLYWGPIRVSQLLAAVSCVAAVAVLIFMAFKQHDPEKMFVNVVAKRNAPTELVEAEQISELSEEVTEEEE